MNSEVVFWVCLIIAMMFEAFYFSYRKEVKGLVCALLSMTAWFECALVWLYQLTSFPEIAVLFMALGVVNAVFCLESVFVAMINAVRKSSKRGDVASFE